MVLTSVNPHPLDFRKVACQAAASTGNAHVFVYPDCSDGHVVADVIQLGNRP